jgi:hypothetical protein
MFPSDYQHSDLRNDGRSVDKNREVAVWGFATGLLSCLLAVFSFQAAMRNYFTGDDFVYLNWLSLAAAEPKRLWTVFWSNSLEAQTTKFYRPLLSLSMALDQQIWGRNALGFHLTNLFFHVLCSLLIFLIAKDVLLPKKCSEVLKLACFCGRSIPALSTASGGGHLDWRKGRLCSDFLRAFKFLCIRSMETDRP